MKPISFAGFLWRVVAAHITTYFVCGLVASFVFDYRSLYSETGLRYLMRPTDTAWVAAGPALQVFRGALFAVVLWPIFDRISDGVRGALTLYGLLLGLAVFGTIGPSPGSLEGAIYTTLPIGVQLVGLPEALVQTAAFSCVLCLWLRRSARWIHVVAAIFVALIVLMSMAGILAAVGVVVAEVG